MSSFVEIARIGRPMPSAASAKIAQRVAKKISRFFGAAGGAGAFATVFALAGAVVAVFGAVAASAAGAGPRTVLFSALVTSPRSCDVPRLTQFCTNIIRQYPMARNLK